MNFEKYKTTFKYPNKTDFITVFLYRNGEVLFKGNYHEFLNFVKSTLNIKINDLEKHNIIKQETIDEHAFSKYKKEYGEDVSRLYMEFESDAIEEAGLSEHPYSKGMFTYAWSSGHSSGLEEIYNVLHDLAEHMISNKERNKDFSNSYKNS